jgi:hypothetical protein
LPRKASLARALRWGIAVATAGAAWLGVVLLLADDNPSATAAVVAAVLALAGGWAAHASARSPVVRILACLIPVILARWTAGTLAAALATACVAAGWWLRVRASDALLVLALFGGVVALLSPPSGRLIVVFLVLGVVTVGARSVVAAARRGLHLIGARLTRRGSALGSGEQASEVSR